jgi:hypothetical protein
MIVIHDHDAQAQLWKDPLLEIHLSEFRQCAGRIDAIMGPEEATRAAELERLSELLCEMSRDLIYRANRVTRGQVRQMIDAFDKACLRFKTLSSQQVRFTDATQNYLAHIEGRISMLEERLK